MDARPAEFKLRFFGSVLGYLWQLMRPLMLFGVLYVVFTEAFPLGEGVPFYPAILLMGIVLYTFFADATGSAVSSVLDRENIVRKVHFPRLAIPVSVVLTAGFTLALNLVAVAVFAVLADVRPNWGWLQFPSPGRFSGAVRFRRRDAALRAVRRIPRRPADLGRRAPDHASMPRRCCT